MAMAATFALLVGEWRAPANEFRDGLPWSHHQAIGTQMF